MSNKNNFFSIANNLENLEENKGYLIWIRCGAFFVAICANAVILSNILGLKRICIKQGVCKVGIPVNSIYDYIKKLERIGDSFVIYNYSKDEMVVLNLSKNIHNFSVRCWHNKNILFFYNFLFQSNHYMHQ